MENTQTKIVTAVENMAIKGYDRIKIISKTTLPAVIGLFLFVINLL